MSSLMVKGAAFAVFVLSSGAAFALEPCHKGVPAIDIEQGNFQKAPGYISPDTQTTNPDGSLKEQGWHNLRQAVRPLRVICRYRDKAVPVVLPETIDSCVFGSRRIVCQ
jgi:hypothetical protein